MAHECLECGQACYCDMDDTWMTAPMDCRHQCPPEDEEWGDDDDSWETDDASAPPDTKATTQGAQGSER